MNRKIIAFAVIGILVIGGSGFYGGIKYAGTNNRSRNQALTNFGMMGTRGGAGMPGLITGEIIAKDEKSLTIKLSDSGSKIIFMSASTSVTKTLPATVADLNTGTNISVQGTANSDGSLNARAIQIREFAVGSYFFINR